MRFTTTSTTEPGARASASGRLVRYSPAIALTAVVASAGVAGLGLVWLLAPGLNPFGNGAVASPLSEWIGATAVAGSALAVGLAGVVLAATLVLGRAVDHRALVGIGAAVITLAMGATIASVDIIAVTGYLFGAAAVVAGVLTIVLLLVRAPRLGLALLAGLIAVLAASVWLAGLTADGVTQFAGAFGRAFAAEAPNLIVIAVVVSATLAWAAIAFAALTGGPAGRRFESWLVRHRRALTILAALGPVPYALARLTWLTPWPVFGPSGEELSPSMLATGLMLGAGAVAASTLTLGLILPWGREFPTWMPGIGGRAVPVGAAVVPGSIAAGILCLAAAPMLATISGSAETPAEPLLLNLVLPFWFWGPMLALAVWAYAAWRRTDGPGEGPG
jgi:hypothetical protein